VLRFLVGFLVASMLWAALAGALYAKGFLSLGREEPAQELAAAADDSADDEAQKDPKKRRRNKRPARSQSGAAARSDGDGRALPQGNATTGDEIDWAGDRQVDMGAGEAQLSGKAIEAGFDSVMSRVRRCLVLVPAEGEVTGKLIFGMRVGGDGQPRAVNLSGPAVVTSGESGSCLRQAAQSIRFPKFDGPDMLFKYPVTLQ
jgi:hypothetical protein